MITTFETYHATYWQCRNYFLLWSEKSKLLLLYNETA